MGKFTRTFLVCFGFSCFCAAPIFAAPPGWWSARGVYRINPQTQQPYAADDYAPANIGQLKNFMRAAVDELDARLPGGASPELHSLIQGWSNPPAPPAAQPDDYAPLNLGQLKNTVKALYDCLAPAALPGMTPAYSYPWTQATDDDDDYAPVNLGQLKHMFDFDLQNTDRDGDGLPDLVELLYTHTDPGLADTNGDGKPDGLEDANGNGICNLDELAFGLNPAVNAIGQSQNQSAFTYDRLGRVRSDRERTAAAQSFTVDSEGNLTSVQ